MIEEDRGRGRERMGEGGREREREGEREGGRERRERRGCLPYLTLSFLLLQL